MKLFNWKKNAQKKTLTALILGDTPVTLAELLDLDELQNRQDIVKAAILLLRNSKHAKDGYDILGPLAAEGDAEAQFAIGEFCESTLERFEQASTWYERAAEQGHANAQRNYADMLMAGKGIETDPELAVSYYEKAAHGGVPEAQFVMGEFYRSGMHRQQDFKKAEYYYTLASENGYTPADTRLQQMRNSTDDDQSKLGNIPKMALASSKILLRHSNGIKLPQKRGMQTPNTISDACTAMVKA